MRYEYTQKVIPQLLHKDVTFLLNLGSHFFFVCNKEYDRNLTVIHSNEEEFKLKVPRRIEPGILQTFDAVLSKGCDISLNDANLNSEMIILGAKDENQFYHILNPKLHIKAMREPEYFGILQQGIE